LFAPANLQDKKIVDIIVPVKAARLGGRNVNVSLNGHSKFAFQPLGSPSFDDASYAKIVSGPFFSAWNESRGEALAEAFVGSTLLRIQWGGLTMSGSRSLFAISPPQSAFGTLRIIADGNPAAAHRDEYGEPWSPILG
jgi:hypothetical protein